MQQGLPQVRHGLFRGAGLPYFLGNSRAAGAVPKPQVKHGREGIGFLPQFNGSAIRQAEDRSSKQLKSDRLTHDR